MNFTKEAQYGILLCLYLCRSGRANVYSAARNMKLSSHFLTQVARKLRVAGLLISTKGPGGGYELSSKKVTVYDILHALNIELGVLSNSDYMNYVKGSPEERSLALYTLSCNRHVYALLDETVERMTNTLVNDEMAQLNSINETGIEQ